jgi:hypothetical protein
VVEGLPSMHEGLDLISNIAKKKKEKKSYCNSSIQNAIDYKTNTTYQQERKQKKCFQLKT